MKYSEKSPPSELVHKFESREFAPTKDSEFFEDSMPAIRELRERVRYQLVRVGKSTRNDSAFVDLGCRLVRTAIRSGSRVSVEAGTINWNSLFGVPFPSIYITISSPDGRIAKIRLADHEQPSYWKGGFDRESGKVHRPASVSIVLRGGVDVDRVIRKAQKVIRDFSSGEKNNFWTYHSEKKNRVGIILENSYWVPGIEINGGEQDESQIYGIV